MFISNFWRRASTPKSDSIQSIGRVTPLIEQGQVRPSYLIRGTFGNLLIVGELSQTQIAIITTLGGVKYSIPSENTLGVLKVCEHLFTKFGARILSDDSIDVAAPIISHSLRAQALEGTSLLTEKYKESDTNESILSIWVREERFHYPSTINQTDSLGLPQRWQTDYSLLCSHLKQQKKLLHVLDNLKDKFDQSRVLAFFSKRMLCIAVYDDFDYDRIDYDTLSPTARSELRTILISSGASALSASNYIFEDIEIKLLKSPRSLSSPVTEGLTTPLNAIYILTPTQLAAHILSSHSPSVAELMDLASILPFNLTKLIDRDLCKGHLDTSQILVLRNVIQSSGEFYRKRRQKGIKGTRAYSSKNESDPMDESELIDESEPTDESQ